MVTLSYQQVYASLGYRQPQPPGPPHHLKNKQTNTQLLFTTLSQSGQKGYGKKVTNTAGMRVIATTGHTEGNKVVLARGMQVPWE